MGLRKEPLPEMDKHRSFGLFSSAAKSKEAADGGVDALRLHEEPSGLPPTVSFANTEAAEWVQYPLRPSEPDCSYYLKTGCCKFGCYCRFNHPRERRLPQAFNSKERDRGFPKQDGQCKFYLMPGGCRFGEACKYSYSHGKSDNAPVDLNVIGLPFRPGKGECSYYIRTGICKYSTNCKFHHPEPKCFVGARVFGFQNGITFENKIRNLHLIETSQTLKTASNECIPLLDSSKPYVPAMSFSQWLNVYVDESRCQDSSSSSLEKTTSCPPLAVNQNSLSKLVDASMQMKTTIDENSKESPNESKSRNCMRCEGFKFIPACTNNHPKDHTLKLEACRLSPIGLPLRPDQPVCIYFGRFGICKYGPACQFDHPMDGSTDQSLQVLSTVATSL